MDRSSGEIHEFDSLEKMADALKKNENIIPITPAEAKEARPKSLEERVAWLEKKLADMEAERRVNELGIVTRGLKSEMRRLEKDSANGTGD